MNAKVGERGEGVEQMPNITERKNPKAETVTAIPVPPRTFSFSTLISCRIKSS